MDENLNKLTVIILDFMKAPRVVEGVKFLLAQKVNFKFKIIVIDNSCNPQNAAVLRAGLGGHANVELIINLKNIGYTRAHNEVAAKIEGEFVMILNPDILFKDEDSLQKMTAYMEAHPDIGVLGPRQNNDSGEIAMSVRAFPRLYVQVSRRTFLRHLPFLKSKVAYDEMRHLDYTQIQDVDWLQSSCVIIRRDLWKRVRGFNAEYFLFMADAEICVEGWKCGYRTVYYPEVQVFSDGKRVSAGGLMTFFGNWVLRQHLKDSIHYRFRHFLEPNPRQEFYQRLRRSKE